MKQIDKNEEDLREINNNYDDKRIYFQISNKNNTAKFSVSNENEYLFNFHDNRISHKKQQSPRMKRIYENKARSEEKYSGSVSYQIFMARNPEIQVTSYRFTGLWEKRFNRIANTVITPGCSATLKRNKIESVDNFNDLKEETRVRNRPKWDDINANNKYSNEFIENSSIFKKFIVYNYYLQRFWIQSKQL